jgi:hypothetical protein
MHDKYSAEVRFVKKEVVRHIKVRMVSAATVYHHLGVLSCPLQIHMQEHWQHTQTKGPGEANHAKSCCVFDLLSKHFRVCLACRHNGKYVQTRGLVEQIMADKIIGFLKDREQDKQPFLTYYAPYAIHAM